MKNSDKVLIYDHSFNGFLSAVFKAFEENINVSDIQSSRNIQPGLFNESVSVGTNIEHAKRVWYSVQKKNYNAIKTIYFAFLSESHGIEFLLYNYIRKIVLSNNTTESYCNDESITKINQLAALVGREKQRIQSQLNLHSSKNQIRFGYVDSAFNVLPLLSKHLKSKYRNEPWIVFDRKRKYGLYYDLEKIQIVSHNYVQNYMELWSAKSAMLKDPILKESSLRIEDGHSSGRELLEERSYSAA